MENVTKKVLILSSSSSFPNSEDIICSTSSSNHVVSVSAEESFISTEKLNLSSEMTPIIEEVITKDDCPIKKDSLAENLDSVNDPKDPNEIKLQVQTTNKDIEKLIKEKNETFEATNTQLGVCSLDGNEIPVISVTQEKNNPGMKQDVSICQETETDVIENLESSESTAFECTNIILVTDSTATGTAECQIVEAESPKIFCKESSENSTLKSLNSQLESEETLSSHWSLFMTNEQSNSKELNKNNDLEANEKNVSKFAESHSEETYIAIVKNSENEELVSKPDQIQSENGLTAEEMLIAISVLENNATRVNSDCPSLKPKTTGMEEKEQMVSISQEGKNASILVREQSEESLEENSDQNRLIEIGVQANDYEIERRSGKVPARHRVIPCKFRDYWNPDLVEQGSHDSDSDYFPPVNGRLEPNPKRRKVISSTIGQTGRKPGRPRKIPPDNENESSVNSEQKNQVSSIEETTSSKKKKNSKSSNKKKYICKICQHSFGQKGNLKVHMKVHTGEKPFLCTMKGCTKRFQNNESLKRHNRVHLGIKPFTCEVCKNKFSSKICLQEHMTIHTNSKPHLCQICNVAFRQISCLRRHLLTHSTEKPFECITCGQKFSQMVYLRSHSKVHTGEKPFVCDQCQRGFAHQSDLIRHKIIHSGKKPYECPICHAKFNDPSTKRRHVKEHMEVKPFSCNFCKDSFRRADRLKVHLASKHSNQAVINNDNIERIKQSDSGQIIPFNSFKDASGKSSAVTIDDKSVYHKKIAQIVEGLTGGMSEVTNHMTNPSANIDNVIFQETIAETPQNGDKSQSLAQVVANAMQSAGMTASSITSCNPSQLSAICQATNIGQDESDCYSEQITATILEEDIPSFLESTSDGATVITIVSLEDVEQEPESICPTEHREYPQGFLENLKEGNSESHLVEVHYEEQNGAMIEEEKEMNESESQTLFENNDNIEFSHDYITKPDFNSQQYFDWLSNFSEICKNLSMPLNSDLFHKISQVHKTLSDVMATPSGVIADKENFRNLMNISRGLHFIINEHLGYVLQNLDGDKNLEEN